MKKQIKSILMAELSRVYCNNYGPEDEDQCDGCNRKAMNWSLGDFAAEEIAEKIININDK